MAIETGADRSNQDSNQGSSDTASQPFLPLRGFASEGVVNPVEGVVNPIQPNSDISIGTLNTVKRMTDAVDVLFKVSQRGHPRPSNQTSLRVHLR